MKKSRFTEEQIIGFLKQAEAGMPIKELYRNGGFNGATFCKWRAKFGGMQVSEAQRLELSCLRTHRIWRQAGLLLPKKRPRRRIASNRTRAHTPFKANAVWAYDFVFDTTAEGQQIKCLTVIDEDTRECLAIDVAGSNRSSHVVEVLSWLVSIHGAPLFMRSDNGAEFVSHAILEWISQAGIATALSDHGKPWQNGANESSNGKLRNECLSLEWFRSRKEAVVIIEASRLHYNTVRPHSSLDYRTPHEFKQHNQPIPNRAVFQE